MTYTAISSFSLGGVWPTDFGSSGTLAVWCSLNFVADDFKEFLVGSGESLTGEFVTKAAITVVGGVATVTSFSLPKTDLASPQNVVRYSARIFDANGAPRDAYPFENFHLKSVLGDAISFLAWQNDNAQVYRGQLDSVPTTAQMNTAILAALDNAPTDATYITQTPNASLSAEQALSSLSTGLLINTTTTGILTSLAHGSNGQVLSISGGVPAWAAPTNLLISTGTINIGADTDASGTDGITLQTRGITRLLIANDGTFTFSSASAYLSSSAPQAFSQIDQISGTPTSAKAGTLIETALNASSLGTFNVVGRIYAGTNNNYVVGVLGEARSTVNVASAAEVIGVNGVADSEVSHTGHVRAIEADINFGTGDASANYTTNASDSHFGTGLLVASGGRKHPNAGIHIVATTSNNKFRYGVNVNSDAYDTTGIFAGDAVGPSNGIVGELVVRHINTRDALAVQASASGTGGTAFNVYSSAAASVASILPTGEYISTAGYKTTGAAAKFYCIAGEGMEFWKDSTPTKAAAASNKVPGGSVTDDFLVSLYDGATWTERFRVNATDVYAKAMTSLQWLKDATPSKAFAIGNNVPGSAVGDDYVLSIYNGSAWTGRMRVAQNGDTVLGAAAALATNATAGFVFLPSCAGAATGTPAGSYTGMLPMVVDSTNFKIYINFGGTWKSVTLA